MAESNPHTESPNPLSAEPETGPPRKKVRKGTRSCWECKRRKVRCVFATATDTICHPCKRRRTSCVSQEFPDEPETRLDGVNGKQADVYNRLDRVEALVKTLVERMTRDANSSSGLFQNGLFGSTSHTAAAFGRGILANPTPLSRPLTPATSITWVRDLTRGPTKYEELSRRLSAAWPSQRELDLLFNTLTGTPGSLLLKAAGMSNCRPMALQDVLRLPPPGSHPVLIARKLLLLSIVLQGAASGSSMENLNGLSTNRNKIMSRAAEAASLVTGNDEFAGSVEGIECVMMESLYHDLAGNLRQAWVAIRRAITMAQMMGLHRGTDAGSPSSETPRSRSQTPINPEQMWLRLVQADRYASLLLGLPHGSSDDVFASPRALERCTPVEQMRRLDCLAAGRILQRTAADISNYATTREIDELLQKAAASMPPLWWLTPELAASRTERDDDDTTTAAIDGTTLIDQLVHFHMVARLHLPYLLQMHSQSPTSTTDDMDGSNHSHNHAYSKITAVTATREMLTRYLTFRSRVSPTGTYCRGMDFFAFVAAATLCVAHVEGWCWRRRGQQFRNGRGTAGSHGLSHLDLLAHQRPGDRGLAERALACIEHIARVNDGDATTEGMVIVLGGLLAVEEDAANGGVYRTGCSLSCSQGAPPVGGGEVGKVVDGGRVVCVYIPHFGTFEVEREESELLVQETAGGVEEWALDGADIAFEDLVEGLGESGVGRDEQWAGWVGNGSW